MAFMATKTPAPEGASDSFEGSDCSPKAVEEVWVRYWAPILAEGGMARLKGELFDAYHLVNEARQVYRHATGGLCDDLCASAEGIIAMDGERVARLTEALTNRISTLEAELALLRSPQSDDLPPTRPLPHGDIPEKGL